MKRPRYVKKRLKRKRIEVDRNLLDPYYPGYYTSWRRHPIVRKGKVYWLNDILKYSVLKALGKFISSHRRAHPSVEHAYSRYVNMWKPKNKIKQYD